MSEDVIQKEVDKKSVSEDDEENESFDNRKKRRHRRKNGRSRSRSSTDRSSKSSVGYGSGDKHGSQISSKHSEMGYTNEEGNYDPERHTTAIAAVLNNLRDDILYCHQSEIMSRKNRLKTVSDFVSNGGEEVFIEGRRGFVPSTRSAALRNSSRTVWLEEVSELDFQTPLDLAILIQRFFTPLSTICFGLLGGVAFMQAFLSYGALQTKNSTDLLKFVESNTIYARVAPTIFYILVAVCIVAVFDRFDLAHLDLRHCSDTLFYRQGWFLLLIYIITLFFTLWTAELDDMLMLYPYDKSFTKNREELYGKLSQWHTLNICRCVFAVLGWLVISITEPDDLLLHHLKAIKQFDVQPKDILLVSSPPSTSRY